VSKRRFSDVRRRSRRSATLPSHGWPHAGERRTPNAERRTPNAERRTPNAERRTPNAETPNAEPRTLKRRTPNPERSLRERSVELLYLP
jgi:hypothetical protein